jgi:glycosyltransferase involved in cell wall biosynthesis
MLVCSPGEAYYECRRTNPQPGKPFRRWELEGQRVVGRLNARVGTRYIVLSQHLADVVRGHGWSGPVDVVPIYGVDTNRFRPASVPRDTIRRELRLPESGSILFFSSRVAPEKDSEAVLRAVRKLLDAGRDLWLLHRSGGFAGFLRDAERFGVRDRVIAADAVHPHRELPLMYEASDVCVQASRAEGLGFSPLEALACGVPVIATNVGGLRETIRDGDTGWSYPMGDADALARCIQAALDDPAEAARRAANGREMVVREYDERKVFEHLLELVHAVVQ